MQFGARMSFQAALYRWGLMKMEFQLHFLYVTVKMNGTVYHAERQKESIAKAFN